MKNTCLLILLLLSCISFNTYAQTISNELQGSVSFISSQHIYVKFVTTTGIHSGDTLYISKNNRLEPALLITELSSISCVGKPIGNVKLTLSNSLIAIVKQEIPLEVQIEKSNEPVAVNDLIINQKKENDSIPERKFKVDGRLSVSSYSNFSSNPLSLTTPNYRLRYNLALNLQNIANSKLSFENYMSFTHKLKNPLEKYDNLNIYNLALKFDFDKSTSLIFGRKINANTANIGAVDGLQFEKGFGKFSVGALAGTRPNDSTYGFDAKLFQFGGFVGHRFEKESQTALTSIGFFNQTNSFKTDRRYLYLQHSNHLLKNVDFFGSAEIDLYAIEGNQPVNDFDFTSMYLSLSYRPVSKLSLSVSYDARKNVYYYETYKNRIDSLLEKEMRQGLRFRFNYRPFKSFTWGGNAGYRLQTPIAEESLNAISYLSYSSLPWINASIMLTGTALKTANLSGFIYGICMSKDFLNGKLAADIEYRKAQIFEQDIAELSLSWRISKNLFLSTNYEISFESDNTFQRLFLNITKRF